MAIKTALVTGASSGIGEATARKLRDLGYTVYGAGRRTDRLERLVAAGIHPLTMDITDDESVSSGVKTIIAATGGIDVLVNNAGYGSYGALEDVPLTEARRQFEVNVFGAARLTQLVLPHMRAQRSGTIVNVTSMGGKIYTPMGGWYHSTKFALEALSDCLRLEAGPFGVRVVVVEPGGIRTEWAGVAADNLKKSSTTGAYARQADAMVAMLGSETVNRRSSPPSVVADAIGRAVTARRPKTRYVTGFGARPLLLMRHILPDRAFDALIARVSGVPI
jgi:NAD(P)-dependent dehydrogenase (short-subunit alcohol dehydrogenase family)